MSSTHHIVTQKSGDILAQAHKTIKDAVKGKKCQVKVERSGTSLIQVVVVFYDTKEGEIRDTLLTIRQLGYNADFPKGKFSNRIVVTILSDSGKSNEARITPVLSKKNGNTAEFASSENPQSSNDDENSHGSKVTYLSAKVAQKTAKAVKDFARKNGFDFTSTHITDENHQVMTLRPKAVEVKDGLQKLLADAGIICSQSMENPDWLMVSLEINEEVLVKISTEKSESNAISVETAPLVSLQEEAAAEVKSESVPLTIFSIPLDFETQKKILEQVDESVLAEFLKGRPEEAPKLEELDPKVVTEFLKKGANGLINDYLKDFFEKLLADGYVVMEKGKGDGLNLREVSDKEFPTLIEIVLGPN